MQSIVHIIHIFCWLFFPPNYSEIACTPCVTYVASVDSGFVDRRIVSCVVVLDSLVFLLRGVVSLTSLHHKPLV